MTVQKKIDRVRELHNNMYREALIANEKLMTLEQLSGYSIDTLISLFAEGFKLIPPENATMNQILKALDG